MAIITSDITTTRSYVDWGAVLAGTAVASAISFVLLTFGGAIGLSMVSPFRGEGASKAVFAVALGLWLLWVVVSSFMAGGYLTGRMRHRVGDASEHEVDVRDGAHGLTVWAVGIILAALLTAAGVTGIVRATDNMTATAQRDYVTNLLFRSGDGRPTDLGEVATARRETAIILAAVPARGELTSEDRVYLVRLVAVSTGLSRTAAEQRVDDVIARAKQIADDARKAGVIAGFFTAVALLLGAVGAWWSARMGGRHRDEGTSFAHLVRW